MLQYLQVKSRPAFHSTQRWTCTWCCCILHCAICGLEKGLDFRISPSLSPWQASPSWSPSPAKMDSSPDLSTTSLA